MLNNFTFALLLSSKNAKKKKKKKIDGLYNQERPEILDFKLISVPAKEKRTLYKFNSNLLQVCSGKLNLQSIKIVDQDWSCMVSPKWITSSLWILPNTTLHLWICLCCEGSLAGAHHFSMWHCNYTWLHWPGLNYNFLLFKSRVG